MKKSIILVVIILIAVVLGIFGYSSTLKTKKDVIKIGVVAPLTGGAAAYGVTLVKGIEMALADVSKNNTRYSYEIIVEDDASTPTKSATAAQKLVNVDQVKAIISVTSGSGNSIKTIAEKAGVVHVCDCNDVTIGNTPYNFTNLILPPDEVKAWLDEAQKRGNKTIAVLAQTHPGFVTLVNNLLQQVGERGMSVVFNESFSADTRDFKTIVAKAKSKNPDIYLVGSFPPALDIATKELKDNGVSNISTMGVFTASPNPSLYNGLWFTDSTLTDKKFMERFVNLYPDIRFNARTVPYGYDIFNMLVQSFEKGGDAYANLKAVVEYDGKVGKITKDSDSQNFRSSASIWTMIDGVPVMAE